MTGRRLTYSATMTFSFLSTNLPFFCGPFCVLVLFLEILTTAPTVEILKSYGNSEQSVCRYTFMDTLKLLGRFPNAFRHGERPAPNVATPNSRKTVE